MGVGIYLTGKYGSRWSTPAAEKWFARVSEWLSENGGEPYLGATAGSNHQGEPTLFVKLHPAAEDLELIIPEKGRLIASAKTSTVGPGYHIFLCDLLKQLGEDLRIAWDPPTKDGDTGDETGYFHGGSREDVDREMLAWLQGTAAWVLEQPGDSHDCIMLSMPMDHSYRQEKMIVTPLGPRDRSWFQCLRDDPTVGQEFFPWWSAGVGPDFFIGRALTRMWTEVRWRIPRFDDEADLLQAVHSDLENAFWLDSTRGFPWSEWRELIGYLEQHGDNVECKDRAILEIIESHAIDCTEPRIGYRRRPVRVHLGGGWSIEIPGEFAEQWDEDGNWSAWDGGRTVWFTSFSIGRKDRNANAEAILEDADLGEGEFMFHPNEHVIGKALFQPYEEDGKALWNLKAACTAEGQLAICNIYLKNARDRDWAIGVWHSIKHS